MEQEVKKPKKSLLVFYIILLTGLLIFNLVVAPLATLAETKWVDYEEFKSMLVDKSVGRVHIPDGSNKITFKEKGGVQLYATVIDEGDDLAALIEEAGAVISDEELTAKRSVVSVIMFNWVLPILAFVIIGLVIFYPKVIGQKSEQLFTFKKTKWFWLYFVVAAITSALCIFLLPIWEKTSVFFRYWSDDVVQIILAILVLAYIVIYLLKTFNSEDLPKTKALQAMKIAEISALFLLIILCFVEHFGLTSFVGPCFVAGCVLYLRGLVQGVKGYLYTHKKKESYSVLQLIFCFLAITAGTVLIVHPFSGDGFMWLISIAVWVATALLIVWGIYSIPERVEVKPEPKPEEKPEPKPEEKPAPKPKAKPKAKPEEKPEEKPAPKPKAKPKAKPEEKPEPKPTEEG